MSHGARVTYDPANPSGAKAANPVAEAKAAVEAEAPKPKRKRKKKEE